MAFRTPLIYMYIETLYSSLANYLSFLLIFHTLVAACVGEPPSAPSNSVTISPNEDFRFLNGSITYTCPPGMVTVEGNVNQTVTCSQNSTQTGYTFLPSPLNPCNGEMKTLPLFASPSAYNLGAR